jgi:seryl-tRNA synthetase
MFVLRLNHVFTPRPLSSSCRRQLSALSTFHPDLPYLLNPANRNEIKANAERRNAGQADIDRLAQLARQLHENPLDEAVCVATLKEALKIPNKTHPDTIGLTEPRQVKLKEFSRKDERLKKKPQGFENLAGVGLKAFRTAGVKSLCGDRSYYLTDQLAELEQALVRYTMKELLSKWEFEVVSVPDMLSPDAIEACGMDTKGKRSQVFRIDPRHEQTASALSGTSEMAFGGMLSNRMVPPMRPLKLFAVSRCFRAETSPKKEERPIFRVTQFTKAEMFAVCGPEESDSMLEHFLEVQECLFSGLGLAYQVLEMPPHDMGAPAYRKYDIEAYLPGRMASGMPQYGEISSSSNCTDFQSRRLNIRNGPESEKESTYCHTVNGTACAVPRMVMAICEQFQMGDGRVSIPKPLVPLMRGEDFISSPPRGKWHAAQLFKSPKHFVGRTLPGDRPKHMVDNDNTAEDDKATLDPEKVKKLVDALNNIQKTNANSLLS